MQPRNNNNNDICRQFAVAPCLPLTHEISLNLCTNCFPTRLTKKKKYTASFAPRRALLLLSSSLGIFFALYALALPELPILFFHILFCFHRLFLPSPQNETERNEIEQEQEQERERERAQGEV